MPSLAQLRDLIVSPGVEVSGGMDVLDLDRSFIEDVSGVLRAASVGRDVDAQVHGRLTCEVARDLDWPRVLLAPHMTLTSASLSHRFDLGVYVPQIPERPAGETPATFTVEADDILARVNVPHLDSVEVDEATEVLAKVRELLDAAGLDHSLDSSADGKTFDDPKVWPWSEQASTLEICNELLDAIGYRRLWADQSGRVRSQEAVPAADRAVEWVYDVSDQRQSIVLDRSRSAPARRAPNRWVFTVGDPMRVAIEEDDGIYTRNNLDDGPTSQDARGGWIIATQVDVDVVDQESLVRKGDEHVERALRDADQVTAETGPQPLTWHRTVVRLLDPVLGDSKRLVTSWSLDVLSGAMSQQWRRA